jgi:hypothetical protein
MNDGGALMWILVLMWGLVLLLMVVFVYAALIWFVVEVFVTLVLCHGHSSKARKTLTQVLLGSNGDSHRIAKRSHTNEG